MLKILLIISKEILRNKFNKRCTRPSHRKPKKKKKLLKCNKKLRKIPINGERKHLNKLSVIL